MKGADQEPGRAKATGPPWFVAHFLFDGDSVDFGTFVHERITTLGEAWGREILGNRIGHPGECDAFYEQMRSERRAKVDEENARLYEKLVEARGSEAHHILRETENLARILGVSRERLPAIAFRTLPAVVAPAILHIRSAWLATRDTQRILSNALQTRLSPSHVRALVRQSDRSVADLTKHVQTILDDLAEYVRRRLSGRAPRPVRPSAPYDLDGEIKKYRLVIEQRTRRVFVDGREVKLTNLPFHLLTYLADAAIEGPGWVEGLDVEDHLWPGREDIRPYQLKTVVRRLREGLQKGARIGRREAKNLIATQRNAGHRLDLPSRKIRIL